MLGIVEWSCAADEIVTTLRLALVGIVEAQWYCLSSDLCLFGSVLTVGSLKLAVVVIVKLSLLILAVGSSKLAVFVIVSDFLLFVILSGLCDSWAISVDCWL